MTELVKHKARELFGERGLSALGALAYIITAVGLALSVGGQLGWLIALLEVAAPLILGQIWKLKRAELDALGRVDQAVKGQKHGAPHGDPGPVPDPL